MRSAGDALGDTDRAGPGGVPRTDAALVDLQRTRRTNHPRYGTISRFVATTDDGIEREVIHGQSSASSGSAAHRLTIGTAPPLSLGPEGLTMHFLLKSMEVGIDGIVFGPERSAADVANGDEIRRLVSGLSFHATAHAAHLVCDRLATDTSAPLQTMLWTGVSLGAMKGIAFASLAPSRGRTMAYSHFVVPASPFPRAVPTVEESRRFTRTELGAMMRLSSELIAHDMRSRMFQVNQNVARAARPGLMWRYARSVRRDSVSSIFTDGWRTAVVSGEAGVAATRLPRERLATFELFDRDDAGPVDVWRERLGAAVGDKLRVVVKRGRHTDAMRLSHQIDRSRRIRSIVRQINDGVPVDDLRHPYG